LKTLPNCLLIEGHTDSTPYSNDNGYSNWDLSADRANSARRILQQNGVRNDQVTQVRGYADQMLRVKDNPTDPSNRRVSILVKNDTESVPDFSAAKVVNGTTPLPAMGKEAAVIAPTAAAPQPGKTAAAPAPALTAASPTPTTTAPSTAKPAAGIPSTKPGLMDRLKSILPGSKK
jgi:chemotaxis protein MotB